MTEAGNQVEGELIVRAIEQAPSLNFAEPKINSGCKIAVGFISIDSAFKITADDESLSESLSERIKEKQAHLFTIMSNYEICSFLMTTHDI